MARPWNRVLLKLSGESFCEDGGQGISPTRIEYVANLLLDAYNTGVQLAVVVGGGNIIRGATLSEQGINRITADNMGMLGTLINGLALQEALEKIGVPTRVQSAIHGFQVAEPYIRRKCVRHLEKGRLVILAGGGGVPLFTTDTASALRAKEIEADALFKATKVDGVYTADPKKDPHAELFVRISYDQVVEKNLKVMDTTAILLAKENNLPILVFNVRRPGNLMKALQGDESVGTVISQ